MRNSCRIRTMCEEDCKYFAIAFQNQGWNKPEAGFREYYFMHCCGGHTVLVAEWEGYPAGYLIVRPQAIPELADFNVLMKYQRRGIGNALMDEAEKLCQGVGYVSLAVGLHSGYGQAQKMYVKRGYLFDGSGVWYRGKQLAQYALCRNDDDLVLYMKKEL